LSALFSCFQTKGFKVLVISSKQLIKLVFFVEWENNWSRLSGAMELTSN
jgi:hypothetical protein